MKKKTVNPAVADSKSTRLKDKLQSILDVSNDDNELKLHLMATFVKVTYVEETLHPDGTITMGKETTVSNAWR